MNINLELYRVFCTVADAGTLSEAANRLFISQSAVSQSIKQLETKLELSLFRRSSKGVTLTSEGKLLYEYAYNAIDLLQVAEGKLQDVKALALGELKIAASDTISSYILPQLEHFSRLYPKIRLQIINRTTTESVALLRCAAVDLAFINAPISYNDVSTRKYIDVHDIFVAANDEKFKREFSVSELAALPLILLEPKSNSRLFVEDWFSKNGVSISPEIELGSHSLLLEFARSRLGVACVIKEFSKAFLDSGELIALKTKVAVPAREIDIAWLSGVTLSNAANKFMELGRS